MGEEKEGNGEEKGSLGREVRKRGGGEGGRLGGREGKEELGRRQREETEDE